MPLTVITKKTIALMGSRRLDEVLAEQTGLALVSDLGAGNRSIGLQMQGLSAEYITILINGQPLTGRNDGNFDLSRISVAGIERIEIIKGAASGLYGSEALGGVINIITKQQVDAATGSVSAWYGSNQTIDAGAEAATPWLKGKATAWLSANYYKTAGFNVNPYLQQGTTSPPYTSYSLQGKSSYHFHTKHTLSVSGRYTGRHSVMTRHYGAMPSRDVLDEQDAQVAITLGSRFNQRTRTVARYYFTRYASAQEASRLLHNDILQSHRFTEYIHRADIQFNYDIQRHTFTAGAGAAYHTSEYASTGAGHLYNYFAFVQHSYKPVQPLQLTAGLRYDGNTLFATQLSPTLGLRYEAASWLTFKTAIGKGFRAPTYQHLYQVFTNMMQGYTVVGTAVFDGAIKQLQAAGQVQQLWPEAKQVSDLQPESATSYNAGISVQPAQQANITVNVFYNNIRNLINTQQIGIKSNGAQLFSFINVARAYTRGLEANFNWQPVHGLTLTGGYQLLYAKDRAVIDSIKNKSAQYDSVRSYPVMRGSTTRDYFNMPNRSRHMANLQLAYTYTPLQLTLSVRAIYRGKYGFLDQDNNGFIDPYDVFVKGYVLLHASLQKKMLKDRFCLQLTMNNINGYTDYLMPAQAGRTLQAGCQWRFLDKHKK